MKKCSQCKQTLPITDFYIDKRDNTARSYCKLCSHNICKKYRGSEAGKQQKKLIRLKYRKQMLDFCNELKSTTKCQVCKDDCVVCLDFHHLHSKKDQVTSFSTWTKLLAEIGKCIILCCKCHRKGHAGMIELPKVPLTIPTELLGKFIQRPERVTFTSP